jgi:predicted RNase H-like HicB family nuclease
MNIMNEYTIIIEKGDGNYSAYCPDLPGVVAADETEEKTTELMKEAIEFHLDGLKEDKIPIPEPTISARSVEIAV